MADRIRPGADGDWLLVAGDVAERLSDVEATLRMLASRFATVLWTPGNHELWSRARDTSDLVGEARYQELVRICRGLGVLTPEDEYPVFPGADAEYVLAPLFLLYDYSFRERASLDEALHHARDTGVYCSDEFLLRPDPYPSRIEWCRQRVAATLPRLEAIDPRYRTVLVAHWPLHRGPTRMLRHPQFAMWCGTEQTADWHVRFRAEAVVYGHLHIPLSFDFDGVRFDEVSLGYPREWRARSYEPRLVRSILPPEPRRRTSNHRLEVT